MDVLIFTIIFIVSLLLARHRLAASSLDWRSVIGFVCGALLGLLFGRLLADDPAGLASATGVPCFVFRLLFVLIGGVAGAGAFREILDQAFPSNPKKRRDNDAAGQR